MSVDLRVSLGRLELANPVLAAAGTFGYGLEFRRTAALERLGGVITKTITLKPRQGNPPPRIVETPAGMLNSVGLQNVGLEAFLSDKLPELAGLKVPVIVSVLGESLEELATLCARLDAHRSVAAIELNLSCPNIRRGSGKGSAPAPESAGRGGEGLMVAQDAEATFAMVACARKASAKPLIAKLSPDVTDPRPIAQAAEQAGADALTAFNTFPGMSIDPQTRRSRLGSPSGGLSGPAIRPLSLYRLWLIHQAVRCPLIGSGGVVHAQDAVEFFIAGASAVAVGTANFSDPSSAPKLVEAIRRDLERRRISSVRELVGTFDNEEGSQA